MDNRKQPYKLPPPNNFDTQSSQWYFSSNFASNNIFSENPNPEPTNILPYPESLEKGKEQLKEEAKQEQF